MNTRIPAPRPRLAALLCRGAFFVLAALSSATAATINFASIDDVTAAFPTTSLQGPESSVGFHSGTGRIHLYATTGSSGGVGTPNANAYSAAGYSTALNFFENGGLTLTFGDISMSNSTGSYHVFNFGLTNGNSGNLPSLSQKIYFQIARETSSVKLISGGSTLATWALGSGNYNNLEYASITLTATTWSATVLSKTGGSQPVTESGTFATALSSSNWSQFYLGMQVSPGATAADRSTNGYIGSISFQPIPEPATVAALAGAGALAAAGALRRRRRIPCELRKDAE